MSVIESVRYQNDKKTSVIVTFAATAEADSYEQVTRVSNIGNGSRLWRMVVLWLENPLNVISDPPASFMPPSEFDVLVKAMIENTMLKQQDIDDARVALTQ